MDSNVAKGNTCGYMNCLYGHMYHLATYNKHDKSSGSK